MTPPKRPAWIDETNKSWARKAAGIDQFSQAKGPASIDPHKVRKRLSGRSANKLGELCEQLAVAAAAASSAKGRPATAHKRPTAYVLERTLGGGRFQGRWATGTGSDVDIGVGIAGGLMEVKHTIQARISLGVVKSHQLKALQEVAAAGQLAVVLVRIKDAWWVVPVQKWAAPPSEPNRKSLRPDHLDVLGLRCGEILAKNERGALVMAPDWPEAIERLQIAGELPAPWKIAPPPGAVEGATQG